VLEFRILGPLEAVGDRGPIRLGGPRQRATLAILLLHANRVVSIERLADDLYAGSPPVTAVTQVQRQVSELRKALGSDRVIETRAPGYVLRLFPDQLDLDRFEQQSAAGADALGRGEPEPASELLAAALALWRGSPFADLADEHFARAAVERLDEIRLAALEHRVDADLALGRHTDLVGELEQLVSEHPYREPFQRQLMLALYRSGRQAEALDAYRRTRQTLTEELGLEPTPALRELERAILVQDVSLGAGPGPTTNRAMLIVASDDDRLADLLAICEPLARRPGHELILARLLRDARDLQSTGSVLNARRASLEVPARTAVFTTADPAADMVRLITNHDVELAMLQAPSDIDAVPLPLELAAVLERSPSDVAVLAGSLDGPITGADVYVPFAGGEHDWAALELAAWLCTSEGARMTLLGTKADRSPAARDASRLLADASLAVQRVIGIETESLLVDLAEDALAEAVKPAALVVMGISPRWRAEGIGAARRTLVDAGGPPAVLVHRGPRPGALAPRGSDTRFTWSMDVHTA
jgi:DNA-binding SARP family transcriptional activator